MLGFEQHFSQLISCDFIIIMCMKNRYVYFLFSSFSVILADLYVRITTSTQQFFLSVSPHPSQTRSFSLFPVFYALVYFFNVKTKIVNFYYIRIAVVNLY